jgi:pimeloyl-ACP methyl ester carboxylesterase
VAPFTALGIKTIVTAITENDGQVHSELSKVSLRLDVDGTGPEGCRYLGADVFWSRANLRANPTMVFCFPGGGMSRGYYDIGVPGYSMARHLAAQGFLTITMDHPGTGGSDVPTDPWTLTPEVVAEVDAAAVTSALEALASGEIEGMPAVRPARVIGLGHSAGAMIVMHQQSRRSPYAAIALLGWAGHGLPEHLDKNGLRLAHHPERLGDELVEAARMWNSDPLPETRTGSMAFLVANRPSDEVRRAMVDVNTRLLGIVGYATLIPGSAAPATAAITVPVFLGIGDRDIAQEPRRIPADFPSCGDMTVFVIPDTGHNHNVEPNRFVLWDRIAAWAGSMRAGPC